MVYCIIIGAPIYLIFLSSTSNPPTTLPYYSPFIFLPQTFRTKGILCKLWLVSTLGKKKLRSKSVIRRKSFNKCRGQIANVQYEKRFIYAYFLCDSKYFAGLFMSFVTMYECSLCSLVASSPLCCWKFLSHCPFDLIQKFCVEGTWKGFVLL